MGQGKYNIEATSNLYKHYPKIKPQTVMGYDSSKVGVDTMNLQLLLLLLALPQRPRRVCYKCCNFFFCNGYVDKSVVMCENCNAIIIVTQNLIQMPLVIYLFSI